MFFHKPFAIFGVIVGLSCFLASNNVLAAPAASPAPDRIQESADTPVPSGQYGPNDPASQPAGTPGGPNMQIAEPNGNCVPQTGPYIQQTGQYIPQARTYTQQSGQYMPQSGPYTPQSGQYMQQPALYMPQLGHYMPQSGPYMPQPGAYMAQPYGSYFPYPYVLYPAPVSYLPLPPCENCKGMILGVNERGFYRAS